jgi:LacI family transcriptional regulator
VQNRLTRVGVALLHVAVGYDLKLEADHIRLLLEHGVEGMVLVGTHHRPESYRLLKDREIPFVTTYAISSDPGVPFVGFDNRKAGGMAARYLADLGHRRLAMIAGVTRSNDRAAERVRGFLHGAGQAGIDDVEVIEAPYRMDSGEAALRVLMARRPDITAVFCGSDILAAGAIKACRQRGIAIPDDLSVIGFDNLELAEYMSPPLTTIAIPAETMGERAAEFLLADRGERQLRARVELETQLIVRRTSAPPLGSATAPSPGG